MNYYFVNNVGQIYYKLLPLVANENPQDVTIITFPPLSDFFVLYTKFHVIELKANPNLISRSIFKTLKDLSDNRKEYNKYFKSITSSKVYFFGNSWKLGVFRHIQKLSKNNKIYFSPSDQSVPNHFYPKGFKTSLLNLSVSKVTGVPVQLVSDTGVSSFELTPDYFRNNNIIEDSTTLPPTHKFDVFLPVMENKDILYVSEDLNQYVDGIVKKCEILSEVSHILPNERTLLKPHPNQIESKAPMYEKETLPKIIPSELLMSHPWKYVIGVESIALIKAIQLTNATVISLIQLFDYKDPKRKLDLIDWQTRESGGKILFPKTIEEFKELIQ